MHVILFKVCITLNFFLELLVIISFPWISQIEGTDVEFKISIVNSKLFQLSAMT